MRRIKLVDSRGGKKTGRKIRLVNKTIKLKKKPYKKQNARARLARDSKGRFT